MKGNMLKVTNFKLGIGIPCSYNHVPFPFFISFMNLERPDFIPIPATSGPIDGLRNKIVEDALNLGCSHLIMMDTDQIYPANTITKLLSHKLPIVGCLVHRRYPPFDPLLIKGEINKYENITEWDDGELLEVAATGTGCLMFDMRIFKNMPAPWFKFRPNPDKERGGVIGEDIGFCSDLKQAGYKIYVDTSIKCAHLSTLAITEETWRLYQVLKKQKNKIKEETNNG